MSKEKPNWSKIGKSSCERGKRFERKIKNLLSEATGVDFFRVPRSGGMITQLPVLAELGEAANSFRGDLFAKDLYFLMELKDRGKDLSVPSILLGKGPLFGWWEEAVAEAKESNLLPMLIFNTIGGKKFVMVDELGMKKLQPPDYILISKHRLYLFPFEELISTLHPNLFRLF